jgi:hypothetical protein
VLWVFLTVLFHGIAELLEKVPLERREQIFGCNSHVMLAKESKNLRLAGKGDQR